MIEQEGPNSVEPIKVYVYEGKPVIVDGHHRYEAFIELGYDRVPIRYVRKNQLGRILSDGNYYRSLEELINSIINN